MKSRYVVTVVVDANFGERLFDVAAKTPVWIVDTPGNRVAARNWWSSHPGLSHIEGVTTFTATPESSPEEWFAEELGAVDLHHGEHSHQPPYSQIDVIGATLNSVLREAFAEYGRFTFVERRDGFSAIRSIAGDSADS